MKNPLKTRKATRAYLLAQWESIRKEETVKFYAFDSLTVSSKSNLSPFYQIIKMMKSEEFLYLYIFKKFSIALILFLFTLEILTQAITIISSNRKHMRPQSCNQAPPLLASNRNTESMSNLFPLKKERASKKRHTSYIA